MGKVQGQTGKKEFGKNKAGQEPKQTYAQVENGSREKGKAHVARETTPATRDEKDNSHTSQAQVEHNIEDHVQFFDNMGQDLELALQICPH